MDQLNAKILKQQHVTSPLHMSRSGVSKLPEAAAASASVLSDKYEVLSNACLASSFTLSFSVNAIILILQMHDALTASNMAAMFIAHHKTC